MGDRANIYVVDTDDATHGIYLYSHWGGEKFLTTDLRKALEFGRGRWNDPQYLTRIVISQIFMDSHDALTGAGVSTEIGDNSHHVTILDVHAGQVGWAAAGSERDRNAWRGMATFDQFCAVAA
jgi:hypothetical protein